MTTVRTHNSADSKEHWPLNDVSRCMHSRVPNKPESSAAARRVVDHEVREQAPDPQRHFESPELLLADATVPDDKKRDLLRDWDLELDNRLNAESEGMGVSDPMSGPNEAKLADISRRVKSSLADLAARAGPE